MSVLYNLLDTKIKPPNKELNVFHDDTVSEGKIWIWKVVFALEELTRIKQKVE